METMKIEEALVELRKDKRKFVQSFDLIVNLQAFDVRKESLNTFISIPHPTEKKIAGFLTRRSKIVDSITEDDFKKFDTPKQVKMLAKKYDFFIAVAGMMGKVATKFGRVFGPMNKMPSPQAGIMTQESENAIKAMVEKMKKSIRIRTKEKSIKISIGKEDMSDSDLKDNIEAALEAIEKILPRTKENIKNAMIKLTMSKPIKILDYAKKEDEE